MAGLAGFANRANVRANLVGQTVSVAQLQCVQTLSVNQFQLPSCSWPAWLDCLGWLEPKIAVLFGDDFYVFFF